MSRYRVDLNVTDAVDELRAGIGDFHDGLIGTWVTERTHDTNEFVLRFVPPSEEEERAYLTYDPTAIFTNPASFRVRVERL